MITVKINVLGDNACNVTISWIVSSNPKMHDVQNKDLCRTPQTTRTTTIGQPIFVQCRTVKICVLVAFVEIVTKEKKRTMSKTITLFIWFKKFYAIIHV